MPEQVAAVQDEMSMLDVYQFLKSGFRILITCSTLGLILGLVIAFVLPEKFQASALIEPASVAKKTTDGTAVVAQSVEPVLVLAEKMKSPTYYSATTLQACGLDRFDNAPKLLVEALKPHVSKASPYVSISFRAQSSREASRCLEHVLQDVTSNQNHIAKPLVNNLEVALANSESELQANITERDQQRVKNREKLQIAKMKLRAAQEFVEAFSKDSLSFKFDDPQFSASALLLSTLMDKQNEIKDLEIQISALEMEVSANLTDKDQRVRALTNQVTEMKNALLPPNTKPATFAAPIYSPNTKVEPKRSIVIVVGLLAGGFLGLLLLVVVRVRNNLRQQLTRQVNK